MNTGDSRPKGNGLPLGLSESDVRKAIERSGYPLQLRVAAALASDFQITEEWAYSDRFTRTTRTLDLVAERRLEAGTGRAGHLPVGLRLLIECKRSDLPYVFFKGATDSSLREFPLVHGVAGRHVRLLAGNSAYEIPIAKALGLECEPFSSAAPTCAVFSKIVRKGKRVELSDGEASAELSGSESSAELSGSQAYREIVLPLVSSLTDAEERYRPKGTDGVFPTLTLAICVLDAPMVVVDAASDRYTFESWIRVVRHDVASRGDPRSGHRSIFIVDVVHAEFFETLLSGHISPFVQVFMQRVARNPKLLREMYGTVDNVRQWSWEDVR